MRTDGIYLSDIHSNPVRTREEEAKIIMRARSGDLQAQDEIVMGCLRYVFAIARYYSKFLKSEDFNELLSLGNLCLVENVQRAIIRQNPYGYLQAAAKITIRRYVTSQVDMFERLESCEIEYKSPQPPKAYPRLYEALDQLPLKQREIIAKRFGLLGNSRESLYRLSLEASQSPKGTVAYMTMYRGLNNLRKLLSA